MSARLLCMAASRATFCAGVGRDVVLSDVDPRGDLKSYSGFCFPAQVAHGAVLDLVRRNVSLIFLPHVVSMPQSQSSHESYLCPVTQASSYFLAKAFPDVRFLSPLLDFTQGYESSSALVEMAVQDLAVDREIAQRADLTSAIERLQTLITDLDTESRTRFAAARSSREPRTSSSSATTFVSGISRSRSLAVITWLPTETAMRSMISALSIDAPASSKQIVVRFLKTFVRSKKRTEND